MSRSLIMAAAWMHRSRNLDFEAAMQHIGGLSANDRSVSEKRWAAAKKAGSKGL